MWTAFLLAILAAAAPAPRPAGYDPEKLPFRMAWGAYTVVVERLGTDEFAPQRLRILGEEGHVAREIYEQQILVVEPVELNGIHAPELRVDAYTGGAHCCGTTYFFTRDGGLRNLLTFAGRNGGINGIKDLDGDRRPEIIAGNDALAYFGGLPYAASPRMVMVVGWDRGAEAYVDRTRSFPERTRALATEYRAEFANALGVRGEEGEDLRRSAAAGYYGNAYAIGNGDAARRWLMARLPASTRRWFLAEEAVLRLEVVGSAGKIRVSQDEVFGEPGE